MTAPNESKPMGWDPDEIRIDEPTRNSRLRWVIAIDSSLPGGVAVNAAACLAAVAGASVAGLLGPGGSDADGAWHPGLPWAGCAVLGATTPELTDLRTKALAADDVLVIDMPGSAQTNRVYADYLSELAGTPADRLDLRAVSLFGPKNRIDRLTKRLGLLP